MMTRKQTRILAIVLGGVLAVSAVGGPSLLVAAQQGGQVQTPTPSGGPDDPYDCGDFDTREQVEAVFSPEHDIADLDRDDDGIACEGSFPVEDQTETPTQDQTETSTPTQDQTETPTDERTVTPTPTQDQTETPTQDQTETPTPTQDQTETPTSDDSTTEPETDQTEERPASGPSDSGASSPECPPPEPPREC